MQAFLWRHLVPAQALVVATRRGGFGGQTIRLDEAPLHLAAGGTAEGRLNIPPVPRLRKLELAASDPPEGISVENIHFDETGLAFELRAEEGLPHGTEGNVILEAFMDVDVKDKEGEPTGQTRRMPLGVMPAVPFEVVSRER
jgi:hypothetical protein